jgi:hypothetical protein
MTVAELIDRLRKFHPDLIVVVETELIYSDVFVLERKANVPVLMPDGTFHEIDAVVLR